MVPHRARARALTDQDVELVVLHRRIQHFLDHRRQAMDLVDEQDVARFEIGQQRGQVAGTLQHRAGGLAQVDAHLLGQDMRQRGLAEARRPEDQHVIQRIATATRGLDRDAQLLTHRRLADVVLQPVRADRALDPLLVGAGGTG